MSTALVIGAMKAGTTTLYHDLARLEGVATGKKESGLFSRGDGRLVEAADAAVTVDVCADYAMTHIYPDVPERVARDLGCDVPLIYILRDPVERVESHLRHLSSLGEHVDVEDLDEDHHVVRTSLYGQQARSWLRAGHTGLHVLDFHEYSAHRTTGLEQVAEFLGVQARIAATEEDRTVRNSSADLRSARPGVRGLVRSPAYQRIKPLIPTAVRTRLKQSRLTEPADADIRLSAAAVDRLTAVFRQDLDDLSGLVPELPAWSRNYGG